jgi:hypothetical protein
MPLFTTLTPIQEQAAAAWTTAQEKRAQVLLNGVLDWIKRNAPCLDVDNAAGSDEARMIVSEAILRAIDSSGNIGSENIGPSQVNYIDRAALPTLTRADEAALIALCPRSARRRYGTIRTRPGY